MASNTIDIDAVEQIGRDLDLDGINWGPALKSCETACMVAAKECFAGAVTPDGTPWAAVRRQGKNGKSGRPLNDTGLLRGSLTSRNSPNHFSEIGRFTMETGTLDERAVIHQEGVPGPTWDGRPKRAKFLAIPLTKEAMRAGSPRNFPRKLFVFRPRPGGGEAYLAESQTKGKGKRQKSKLVFQYALVKRVVIPARPFLGWSEKLVDQCVEILTDYAVDRK